MSESSCSFEIDSSSQESSEGEMVLRKNQNITREELNKANEAIRDEFFQKIQELKMDVRAELKQGFQIIRNIIVQMDTRINKLEIKFDDKIDAIETKLQTKINGIEMKLKGINRKIQELGTSQILPSVQFTFRPQLPQNYQMCINHNLVITKLCISCRFVLCCQKCIKMHQSHSSPTSKPKLSPMFTIHHDVRSLEEGYYMTRNYLSKCKIKVQEGLKMFAKLKQIINVQMIKLNKKKQMSKKQLRQEFQKILLFLGRNKNSFADQYIGTESLKEEKFEEMELLVLEYQQISLQIIAQERRYQVFSQQIVRVLHYKNYLTQKQNQIITCQFYPSNYEKINQILDNSQTNSIIQRIENAKTKFQTKIQQFQPSNLKLYRELSPFKKFTKKSYLKTEEQENPHKKYHYTPRKGLFKSKNRSEISLKKGSPNPMKKQKSKGMLTSFLNSQKISRSKK